MLEANVGKLYLTGVDLFGFYLIHNLSKAILILVSFLNVNSGKHDS